MKRKAAICLASWMEEESEKLERSLMGEVLDTGHAIWLYYKQCLSEDPSDTVKEVFGLQLGDREEITEASMKRPDHGTELRFVPGKETRTMLPTPAGNIEAKIITRSIEGRRSEDGAKVYLEYEIWLQNERQGIRKMQMTCQWV